MLHQQIAGMPWMPLSGKGPELPLTKTINFNVPTHISKDLVENMEKIFKSGKNINFNVHSTEQNKTYIYHLIHFKPLIK